MAATYRPTSRPRSGGGPAPGELGLGLCLLLAAICLADLDLATGQVISLRHPETTTPTSSSSSNNNNLRQSGHNRNQQHHNRPPPPLGASIQPSSNSSSGGGGGGAQGAGQQAAHQDQSNHRHSARPGNVIVHFDRNHDIQRLQYVLQDGRLATVFSRPSQQAAAPAGHRLHHSHSHSHNHNSRHRHGPAPSTAHAHGRGQDQAPGSLVLADDQTAPVLIGANEQQVANINNEHTIDILDEQSKATGQLVGGQHVTLELTNSNEANQQQQQIGGPDEHNLGPSKLHILSTIAQDALHQGLDAGQAAMRQKLHQLRAKLSGKLRQLPQLIKTKLLAKSSAGATFFDQAASGQHSLPTKTIVLADEDEDLGPTSEPVIGTKSKLIIDSKQQTLSPADQLEGA